MKNLSGKILAKKITNLKFVGTPKISDINDQNSAKI